MRSLRILLAAPLVAGVTAAMLSGCSEEKRNIVPDVSDSAETPTMLTRDVETLISDSGYTRYRVTSPLWLIYDDAKQPKWRFPDGLDLQKYDNDMRPDSRIVCDSATYFSRERLWRLDGNVRMRNTAGDKFLTQQLFWDQDNRRIYSDSFIHIERTDRILEGRGFNSDDQLREYTILRPSGIFPVPERKRDTVSGDKNAAASTTETIKSSPDVN